MNTNMKNDYTNELNLTYQINKLIRYKYQNIKSVRKSFKKYQLITNKIFELNGQRLNKEGIAHYISYECMLNKLDATFKANLFRFEKR